MFENKETNDIIGRKEEIQVLRNCLDSDQSEFVIVFGRRRIGKTYLIKQFFKEKFSFYATGAKSGLKADKLALFQEALLSYGDQNEAAPKSWLEAFRRLKALLERKDCYREKRSGKRIIFLDEVPWMDSKRSDFKMALDYFWNAYASSKNDIILIVCGSATSWIINNIVKDTGGFYNRVTSRMHLLPFTLKECKELARRKRLDYDEETIAKAYMIFGGVPFYWRLLLPSESLDQGIERLCFQENGDLHFEFQNLFSSLFGAKGYHREIVTALRQKASGLTRNELIAKGIPGGKDLTKALEELDQCGFIRVFNKPGRTKDSFYQIKDPFSRFALDFLAQKKTSSWRSYTSSPSYYSWLGNAFELLCLNHIKEIKNALGISEVETFEYSFRSKKHSPGAQIDLVIERRDGVSNLCEMKCTSSPFLIDKSYAENLACKEEAYRLETKTKNAVRTTLISFKGVVSNSYSRDIRNIITLEDFFR